MAKVTVTANNDFFDHANSIQRTKGSTFILKEEYAKSLGKAVKIGDIIKAPEAEKKQTAPNKKAQPKATAKKSTTKPAAKNSIANGIEKVKK